MRDLIEEELAFSRGIIQDGHELVPRFRIATAEEGEVTIFVQLPDDLQERFNRMALVKAYMKAKLASWFVMASELQEPDAAMVVAVNRQGVTGAFQMINRKPLSFGPVQFVDRDQVGDEIPSMLPNVIETLSAEEAREVERLIAHNAGLRLERRHG